MKTPNADRFGSFFSRVKTERNVLAIINDRFSSDVELHGLTTEAIQQWQKRFSQSEIAIANLDVICFLLHRISARCKSEADQSRIVFDDEAQHRLPISGLLFQLHEACQIIKQEGFIMTSDLTNETSSGNVYEDIGLQDPDEMKAKAEKITALLIQLRTKNLSILQAASLINIPSSNLEHLLNGQFHATSIETIDNYLELIKQISYPPILKDKL